MRFSLFLCLTPLIWIVASQAADPSKEIPDIQHKIEQLDKLEANPANKQLKELYQQILAIMQEEQGYLDKAASLSKQLKDHEAQVRDLKQSMDRLSAPQPEPDFTGKSLQDVERMQEASAAEKIALQNQLDETTARLTQIQARLIPAQSELLEAKKALEQANKEAKQPSAPADNVLANTQLLKKRKVNEAQIAQVQALDLELLSIPNQLELTGLKKSVLGQKLKNLEQYQEKLQIQLRELRKAESASILDESLQLRKSAEEDPALRRLAEDNIALSNQLSAYAETSQAIADRQQAVENQGKLIAQRYALLQQQLSLGGDIGGVGELMRQTLAQLRSVGEENTPQTIKDIQKAQIQSLDYERQLNEAADKEEFVKALVETVANSQLTMVNTDMRERLNSLLELRRNLLGKLLDRNQQSLKSWSLLLNAQNQFNDQIVQFDQLLKENLLWTRTNQAISPAWLLTLLASLHGQGLQPLWFAVRGQFAEYAIPLAGFLIGYLAVHYGAGKYWGPRYHAWQKAVNEDLGNSRRDKFRNTLFMLVTEFVASLPTPLLLLGLCLIVPALGEAEIWTRLLVQALAAAALFSLPLVLLLRLAKPGGFLEGQLRWPAKLRKTLFEVLGFRWLLVALGAFVVAEELQTGNSLRYELGRLPFLALCLLSALGLRRLALNAKPAAGKADSPWTPEELPGLLVNLFVLGELWLAGMEVFGFHLGAVVVQGRLLRTLGWMLLIVLAHQILQRWLLLEQRRMAYARAMAIREERQAAGEEGGEANAQNARKEFAEIQTISLQSKTLLRLLSVTLFVLSLGWVWADMIPALHLLDQVVLWKAAAGPGEVGQTVTLKSLLLTLAVAGLLVLAMRNLPGLLQLLVLPHLNLARGSDFAVTTSFRYLIFAAGVVVMCRLLGLRWDDLQWLVAALSVGLGFGLQEIFANFISGLIILFERPVRIGDIVTLSNGVTGTIDAINTRATTLTDWDNKEIIIPNKTLITEQLTNWSLSSLVIRVVVPVGIAYGSDTELAHRLLLQAAEEHPQVLDKPEKAVFFRAFGASSMDFELRCFVANPNVRVSVIHDLNMRIDKLFRDHGVEIAFPQMDVHIRKNEPSPTPRQARRWQDHA